MSCTKDSGIVEFCNRLKHLSYYGETVREEFLKLVALIEENRKQMTIPIVEESQLMSWIHEIFPSQNEDANNVVRKSLHGCGYILDRLSDIILDPQWLADTLRKVVSSQHTIKFEKQVGSYSLLLS